jgi:hypothetical protein
MLTKKLLILTGALMLSACVEDLADPCRYSGHGDELDVSRCFLRDESPTVAPASYNPAGSAEMLATVYDAHEQMAVRFHDSWTAAIHSRAGVTERGALIDMLREEVLPELYREGIMLYPAFDSLTNGTYASTAALYDRGTIARLVNELGAVHQRIASRPQGVWSALVNFRQTFRDVVEFQALSHAVAVALESYYTKTDLWVLPALHQLPGGRAVLAQITPRTRPAPGGEIASASWW